MKCTICATQIREDDKVVWVKNYNNDDSECCCSLECGDKLKEYKIKLAENKLEHYKNQPLILRANIYTYL